MDSFRTWWIARILIETMRREVMNFKYLVQVIVKKLMVSEVWPFELLAFKSIHLKNARICYQTFLSVRGEMLDMVAALKRANSFVFLVLRVVLIGYSTEFLSMTRGYGIITIPLTNTCQWFRDGGGRLWGLVSIDAGKGNNLRNHVYRRTVRSLSAGTQRVLKEWLSVKTRENDSSLTSPG